MGDLLPLTLLSCQCHLPYILKLYRLYLIIYYFQVIFLVRCELETHFFSYGKEIVPASIVNILFFPQRTSGPFLSYELSF